MKYFARAFVVFVVASTITVKSSNNSQIVAILNKTIYKAPQQTEFCNAIIDLRNSGLTVNVVVPFLRDSSIIKTDDLNTTALSYLETIKKTTGYNYSLEGTSVTFFDPKLMSKRYDPLSAKITINGKNIPYREVINEVKRQTGYLVVDLSSFNPTLTIQMQNGTVRELLANINSQSKSKGWWCGIDQKNGKTLIGFNC